ncbi:cadmium/zinc-transporting ATPase HMA3-like [Olea europaea var. sylvestris]|uniref:cadmium/zinc-transporting ATPase HMA3-like n=1 Tax=Olea europaea var. sylvestris TaxID=158386 RepID=UPI000C1CE524|nr:cadmium/zinc-transporting ATPase HMA3-like [Olea europaea var. sylvestris]
MEGDAATKFQKSYFDVLGLCCSSEVPLIERILKTMDGVKDFSINVPTKTVIVVHDTVLITQLQIVKALNQARLEANIRAYGKKNYQNKWPSPYALLCGALLLLSFLKYIYRPLEWLALVAVAIGIIPIGLRAVASMRNLTLDINILVVIAVAGSIALKDYWEAGTIVFLFTIAKWLESRASYKATAVMSSLVNVVPQRAVLADTGEEINADEVKLNTILAVKAGEIIPIDGVIVDGNCEVDEKILTGESFPASKQKDSVVWASTINLNGYISVKTTAIAEDCVVARMAKLVEEAQNNKSRIQRFIDKCSKYYTPGKLFNFTNLILLVGTLQPYLHDKHLKALNQARLEANIRAYGKKNYQNKWPSPYALLCGALLLLSFLKYIYRPLEWLALVAVAIGIIPIGLRAVASMRNLTLDINILVVIAVAGSIALKDYWEAGTIVFLFTIAKWLESRASYKNQTLIIKGSTQIQTTHRGCPLLIKDNMVDAINRKGIEKEGSNAQDIIQCLGIPSVELDELMECIFLQLGGALEIVHAELLPEDKARIIKELQNEGPTAMIGDGVNDAPALATANIGISMGVSGSALATEAGHVVLMSNDISKIPKAAHIARKVLRKVIENVIIAITTKAAILGLAIAGHPLVWAAVLTDVGTCLLVIFNSMLLLGKTRRGKKCCQPHVHKHKCKTTSDCSSHNHKPSCSDESQQKCEAQTCSSKKCESRKCSNSADKHRFSKQYNPLNEERDMDHKCCDHKVAQRLEPRSAHNRCAHLRCREDTNCAKSTPMTNICISNNGLHDRHCDHCNHSIPTCKSTLQSIKSDDRKNPGNYCLENHCVNTQKDNLCDKKKGIPEKKCCTHTHRDEEAHLGSEKHVAGGYQHVHSTINSCSALANKCKGECCDSFRKDCCVKSGHYGCTLGESLSEIVIE